MKENRKIKKREIKQNKENVQVAVKVTMFHIS
jgi:hypothetical protein